MESKYINLVQDSLNQIRQKMDSVLGNHVSSSAYLKNGMSVRGSGHMIHVNTTGANSWNAPGENLEEITYGWLADNSHIYPTWSGDGWGNALTPKQVKYITKKALEILSDYEKENY